MIVRDSADEFLNSLSSEDTIVSPLSTLAFEALYCGIDVRFYSTPALDELYARSYEDLGIVPERVANRLVNGAEGGSMYVGVKQVFSPINVVLPILSQMRGRN